MSTPSLCGSFLTNKRSLIAFTWTLTTVFTLVAFVVASAMTIHTHIYYSHVRSQREAEYYANQKEQYENEKQDRGHSADRDQWDHYLEVAQMGSSSMTFVAVYTMSMAVALSLYGSTAIVGFTSLRGVYIAPCFSYPGPSRLKVGIFGGAIIFFANLLLVCAVVFGEVRVVDNENRNEAEPENHEKVEVERIATILAVTCMFLSALYTVFAILLFLYYGSEDSPYSLDDDVEGVVVVSTAKKQPSILGGHASDPRRENFITMGGA